MSQNIRIANQLFCTAQFFTLLLLFGCMSGDENPPVPNGPALLSDDQIAALRANAGDAAPLEKARAEIETQKARLLGRNREQGPVLSAAQRAYLRAAIARHKRRRASG